MFGLFKLSVKEAVVSDFEGGIVRKKVLIISSSPRSGGNSDVLADAFAKGAEASGHDVEKISLAGKKIEFCKG